MFYPQILITVMHANTLFAFRHRQEDLGRFGV